MEKIHSSNWGGVRRKSIIKYCKFCGELIKKHGTNPVRNRIFCSNECYTKYLDKIYGTLREKVAKGKKCLICGKLIKKSKTENLSAFLKRNSICKECGLVISKGWYEEFDRISKIKSSIYFYRNLWKKYMSTC